MKKKAVAMFLVVCMITNTACFTAMAEDARTEETAAEETEETAEESAETKEESAETKEESTETDADAEKEDSAKEEEVKFEQVRLSAEEDLSDIVKLGDYKGIDLELQVREITDQYVDSAIQYLLSQTPEKLEDNTPAELGMNAYISYIGKIDGEEFEGGSSSGYNLQLGSHSFIDGFEEGIVGMVKGETKDLNLKFPEEYLHEEVAGKDVVFTVSVLDLYRIPELTDDWVAKNNTTVKTVEEFRNLVSEELEKQMENEAVNTAKWNAWNEVYENSEVLEYPEEDMQTAKECLEAMVEKTAEQMGTDKDSFLESQGYDKETFEAELTENAKSMVEQNLIVQAIIDAEGIDLTDETTQDLMSELAASYYVPGMDELAAQYGNYEANSAVAMMRVLEFIYENANISRNVIKDESVQIDADAPAPETEEAAGTEEGAAAGEQTDAEKDASKEETDTKENAG